jgi:GNAT superfamily N-acetyltransferase
VSNVPPAGGGPAAAALRVELRPIGDPDAQRLVEEVQQEYVQRYGGRDETPLEEGVFDPPRGGFYVGYDGGRPVATGAFRLRDDVHALGSGRTAEVKRMYVAPDARGRGHARAMLAHLERVAAASGAEVMVLETGTMQPEAMALYASSGYEPVPPFGHYSWAPGVRCYARRLVP